MRRMTIVGVGAAALVFLLGSRVEAQAPAPNAPEAKPSPPASPAERVPPSTPVELAPSSVERSPAELLRRERASRAAERERESETPRPKRKHEAPKASSASSAADPSLELDRGAATELDPRGEQDSGVLLSAGLRNVVVLGSGYEPFAERPLFWAFSLSAALTVLEDGPLAFAAGATWDIGRSESSARGARTGITVQRWTAVPEARYQLGPRLRAFGRLGIGAAYGHATLEDAVVGGEREDGALAFTADPGVGLMLQLGSNQRDRAVRFWLALDAGYLWTTGADLALASDRAPERSAPLRLDTVALHGPYTRLSGSLTF